MTRHHRCTLNFKGESMKALISLMGLVTATAAATAGAEEPAPGKQVEASLKLKSDREIPYLLYLPKNYDPAEQHPVMLFLHGRGESNGPLSIVAKWGPPRMAARGEDLQYIIVSPQCPSASRWTDDDQQAGVLELLRFIQDNYGVDKNRIYLTGLSMGGYGTWRLAADYPQLFAAAAPICGGGRPDDAEKLKALPIWVFHGDKDTAVPFNRSVEMVDAIKAAGGTKIRFTSLEEMGHNSWSAAYATPELYSWFNEHTRSTE